MAAARLVAAMQQVARRSSTTQCSAVRVSRRQSGDAAPGSSPLAKQQHGEELLPCARIRDVGVFVDRRRDWCGGADRHSDLVDACRPGDQALLLAIESQRAATGRRARAPSPRRAPRADVHAIARAAPRSRVARIALLGAAEHVVQHALAHRRLADLQAFEAQFPETGFQDQQPADDDRASLVRQAGQVDVVDVVEGEQRIAHPVDRGFGDRTARQFQPR